MALAVTAKRGARQSLRVVAAAAEIVRPAPDGVTILIYHRVGARTPVRVDLPIASFELQMEELAAQNRVVSLDDAVDRLGTGTTNGSGSKRPVVITFDDGTADWVDEVLPVLDRFALPAT